MLTFKTELLRHFATKNPDQLPNFIDGDLHELVLETYSQLILKNEMQHNDQGSDDGIHGMMKVRLSDIELEDYEPKLYQTKSNEIDLVQDFINLAQDLDKSTENLRKIKYIRRRDDVPYISSGDFKISKKGINLLGNMEKENKRGIETKFKGVFKNGVNYNVYLPNLPDESIGKFKTEEVAARVYDISMIKQFPSSAIKKGLNFFYSENEMNDIRKGNISPYQYESIAKIVLDIDDKKDDNEGFRINQLNPNNNNNNNDEDMRLKNYGTSSSKDNAETPTTVKVKGRFSDNPDISPPQSNTFPQISSSGNAYSGYQASSQGSSSVQNAASGNTPQNYEMYMNNPNPNSPYQYSNNLISNTLNQRQNQANNFVGNSTYAYNNMYYPYNSNNNSTRNTAVNIPANYYGTNGLYNQSFSGSNYNYNQFQSNQQSGNSSYNSSNSKGYLNSSGNTSNKYVQNK